MGHEADGGRGRPGGAGGARSGARVRFAVRAGAAGCHDAGDGRVHPRRADPAGLGAGRGDLDDAVVGQSARGCRALRRAARGLLPDETRPAIDPPGRDHDRPRPVPEPRGPCRLGVSARARRGPAPAPAPAGRGQRGQSEAGGQPAGEEGPPGRGGRQRPRGAGGPRRAVVRRRPDGRADAGDGRVRGDRRDPRPRVGDRRPHPDHRHDRPRHEGGSRALPRGGHGRLRLQAAAAPGALRGPGTPGPRGRRRPRGGRGRRPRPRPSTSPRPWTAWTGTWS